MMEYNLNNASSANVFLVKRSNIEDRFDAAFYLPAYTSLLSKNKHWYKCKDISYSIQHPPEYERIYSENGIQLIRSQNIRPLGLNLNESPVYFSEDFLQRKKVIYPSIGDVLIVRSGVNAGDVAVIEENTKKAIIGADNLLLKPDLTKIIPKFIQVYFFTNVGRTLLNRYLTGATNKHISPYYLARVDIPVIPINKQQTCVSIFEQNLSLKQQKESQAQELLDSIDTYLLNELGITLPIQDNSLKNRIFSSKISDLSGSRFDPKLYDNSTVALRQSIDSTNFPIAKLKELIIQSVAGDWGMDENANVNEDFIKCLVIRATEFNNEANLTLDNSRVKYRMIHKNKLSKIDIQENDLLIEKSGGSIDQPVGRIAIITKEYIDENQLCYSNFIHKIRVDSSKVNPEYLFCFLKTMHNVKHTEAMQSQTNGIRNLIMSSYFKQSIILPKITKQTEIAENIKSILNDIKVLQTDASNALESAKQEIEKMILG